MKLLTKLLTILGLLPNETKPQVISPCPVSLKGMLTWGRYDQVHSLINEENFPLPESLVLGSEPKIFRVPWDRNKLAAPLVRSLMDEAGYQPATIWDLLDYGAKNPEAQRNQTIVALGSTIIHERDVQGVCLSFAASEITYAPRAWRTVWIWNSYFNWCDHREAFLGVRKKISE